MSGGALAYPAQRPLLGTIAILLSTILFAAATVGVKLATLQGESSAIHVTMARFLLGTIIMIPAVIRDPSLIRPREPRWVWLRAVSNVIAVFLFFYGVQLTTVSKANLLNMTYPVFVFLFAPFITKERTNPILILFLFLTMIGVWNVVRPDELTSWRSVATGDVLAFGSALVAGFAISVLRRTRRYDSGGTVLFYMMVVGLVANA
ncbi:MAG: EamA family transporter, partial [Spirochaetaceae bacterium]